MQEGILFYKPKTRACSNKPITTGQQIHSQAHLFGGYFSKLNELDLYLQNSNGSHNFAVHDKIWTFIKKLHWLWQVRLFWNN